MPKKPRIRTLMQIKHVKGSETLHNVHGSIFVTILSTLKENQLEKLT